IVPDDSTILVAFDNPSEAYYVAGVLNSVICRSVIASYTYELRQETHILENIYVPKFNPKNELHQKIAELSKKAHEITKLINAKKKSNQYIEVSSLEEELRRVEEDLDRIVAQIYNIPEAVINDLRNFLDILAGKEVSIEEVSEETEAITPSIEFLKTDIIAEQEDYIEVNVSTAGKSDVIELTLDAPWGSQKLFLGDGRHRINIKPLAEGAYELKFRWSCAEYSGEGSIKVVSSRIKSQAPKRPSTLKLE
ncbi:MAG: class I SAM-dependent DNA methyltransferase, partial [Thermoproteota archaeon]